MRAFYFIVVVVLLHVNSFDATAQKSKSLKTQLDLFSFFNEKPKEIIDTQYNNLITFFSSLKGSTHFPVLLANGKMVYKDVDSLLPTFIEMAAPYLKKDNEHLADDDKITKRSKNFNVLNTIKALSKIPYQSRNENKEFEINNYINSLSPSYEKVVLFMHYAYLHMTIETNIEDIGIIYSAAKNLTLQIRNLYEQAQAFRYIANVATHYRQENIAISFYYAAREAIDNSEISLREKNIKQGEICQEIGDLFLRSNSAKSIAKFVKYNIEAGNYFFKAGKKDAKRRSLMSAIAFASDLTTNFSYDEMHTQDDINLNV